MFFALEVEVKRRRDGTVVHICTRAINDVLTGF